MIWSFASKLLLATVLVVCGLGLFRIGQVNALTVSGGDSITVSAVVEPVRIIDLNSSGKIFEIISNSPLAVAPTVIQNFDYSRPLPLTKSIESNYLAIVARINDHATGVIYDSSVAARNKLLDFAQLKHVISYESALYL
jgi:hypothetical protein